VGGAAFWATVGNAANCAGFERCATYPEGRWRPIGGSLVPIFNYGPHSRHCNGEESYNSSRARAWCLIEAFLVEHTILISTPPDGMIRFVKLTPREAQVLLLICQAKSNKAIAFRLQTSTGVVKNHVSRLCRGLDLSSRAELCVWGIQHPQSLMRQCCDSRLHPPGCLCQSAYCSAMQLALPTAA